MGLPPSPPTKLVMSEHQKPSGVHKRDEEKEYGRAKEQETQEEGQIGYTLGISMVQNLIAKNVAGHGRMTVRGRFSDGTPDELIERDSHHHLVTLVC